MPKKIAPFFLLTCLCFAQFTEEELSKIFADPNITMTQVLGIALDMSSIYPTKIPGSLFILDSCGEGDERVPYFGYESQNSRTMINFHVIQETVDNVNVLAHVFKTILEHTVNPGAKSEPEYLGDFVRVEPIRQEYFGETTWGHSKDLLGIKFQDTVLAFSPDNMRIPDDIPLKIVFNRIAASIETEYKHRLIQCVQHSDG